MWIYKTLFVSLQFESERDIHPKEFEPLQRELDKVAEQWLKTYKLKGMRNVNRMYGFCNFSHVIYDIITDNCGYPDSILELGCGNGGNLGKFFDSEKRVGIDPEPDNIERANLRGNGCEYILADHEHLKTYPDKSFDVAFTYSVLDHIEDFTVALPDMIRIARHVVLIEPYIAGEERQAREGETRWWEITWYHDYPKYLRENGYVFSIVPYQMFEGGSGPLYHVIHIF